MNLNDNSNELIKEENDSSTPSTNDTKKIEDQEDNFADLEDYNFGWSKYSEIMNGRFAMLGFLAIILIELINKQSFLNWIGLIN